MARARRDDDWLESLDHRLVAYFSRKDRPGEGLAHYADAFLQVLYVSLRSAIVHRLPFQANALTFISLLALVPALAISFSVAKGLGFSQALRDVIINNDFFSGQQEIFQRIIGYVDNTQVGTLGAVGVVALVLTLVLTISSVEETLNRIWQVSAQRSWPRKFTDYLSVLVICPLLVLAATGFWAGFSSHSLVRRFMDTQVIGEVAQYGPNMGPLLLLMAAFVFIYLFLPNTKVPWTSAILAGAVASVMWYLVQSLYIYFQVGVARYNAIYGGFASLPLFMIWMQVSWMVLLYGAELAHAHHVVRHGPLPRFLTPPLSPAQREALAMTVMVRIARRFYQGGEPWSQEQMAQALDVAQADVQSVVCVLEEAGQVAEVTHDGLLQPARSLDTLTPADVLAALRGGSCQGDATDRQTGDGRVRELLKQAGIKGSQVLSQISLLDLAKEPVQKDQEGGTEGGSQDSSGKHAS